jgi:RNA polymerase sigma-70 factor (ECF subfamily)
MTRKPEEQFLSIINEHAGIIHRICHSYFADADERQDAYQEIIYQLWKSYPNFKSQSKISTWIYKVALNTAMVYIRKSYRTVTTEPLNETFFQVAENQDDMHLREQMQLLYMAINKLDNADKAIILLHLDENNYEEIATIIGISKTNVSVRLFRIKRKLEEILTNNNF